MSISAVIVAAGTGSRLGAGMPKGFVRLGGEPLFLHSLRTFIAHKDVTDAVLVVPQGYGKKAYRTIAAERFRKKVAVVPGGKKRWQSVRSGVLATEDEWVLVHDAARPFVTSAVISAVIRKKNTGDCVITATPEVDTVRRARGGLAVETLDRSTLVRIGTPQLFRRAMLVRALEKTSRLPIPPTDEAELMLRSKIPVALAAGDPLNFKITTPHDMAMAEALFAHCKKK